ncbi:Carbapenem antibiotics biosynthesis protein carD [Fulvivirga imtechensis AK7]|uniref:Carbapenem antibiotics biosynthesis protein carD n=1 Tax=Fulvivirga imtechensis AK7 TaxID=1237149 RepID=L8JYH9_9BACT|nr:proline dehydrogenase family protein [Fulvivirga imtechensis]ELR72704.1 Carbapenem antibiotics biosynthesis protein carD [Fulvivirga imtechensis AK7]
MNLNSNISFDDTSVAFQAKSTKALKKANLMFTVVNNPLMSKLATKSVKLAFALNLPIKGIIKSTVFEHFCGGENIEDSKQTINELADFHIGAILDYAVEGEDNEATFDATKMEVMRTIDAAKASPNIPFSVFKVTGIASASILQKVQEKKELTEAEAQAYERVKVRVDEICRKAYENDVPILIDAEDSWIQEPIDEMVYAMMQKYNQKRAIVYNTFQMYRVDMLDNLRKAHHYATMHNYFFGAKLVRGAYMEKERERAAEMGYPDPIQPNKEATDRDFDKALAFCIDNKQRISLVCGSHNENSNYYLALLMEKHSMKNDDSRVYFAQLYGMSDNISFNLAKAGYNVVKYVPYGPVKVVMPYLFRRAEENTSVAGQSSRELSLIRKELKRREN